MSKTKKRFCLGCGQPFMGRSDARTCSAKCRKRFQRAKVVYRDVIIRGESKPETANAGFAMAKPQGSYYAGR